MGRNPNGATYSGGVLVRLDKSISPHLFSAYAVFVDPSVITSPGPLSDGECAEVPESAEPTGHLDAGETLELSGPSGMLTLDRLGAGFYGGSGPSDLWTAGGSYSISSQGGLDVSSFARTFTMSGDVVLIEPDPNEDAIIDLPEGLFLEWSSSGIGDPIFVSLEQYDYDLDETTFEITCRFDDDGAGYIGPSDLSGMDSLRSATLVVGKRRMTEATIPSVGDVLITAGVDYELEAFPVITLD